MCLFFGGVSVIRIFCTFEGIPNLVIEYISKGHNKIAVKKYIHYIDSFIIANIRILNYFFSSL